MEEIITWLRHVESLACEAYREAAKHFADDQDFSALLSHLAEDEEQHYHLMGSAAALFTEQGEFPVSAIELDEETRRRVERPLHRCLELVRSGGATKDQIVAEVVEAEHSEWNRIFVYVIRNCQAHSRSFQRVAAIMDAHSRRIDSWVTSLPEPVREGAAWRPLPKVWERRFLVVEDDEPVRELFAKILSMEGEVVTAANGEEGLAQVRNSFFDVIISDNDMPFLTGAELFRFGQELDPNLGQHFILCTGRLTDDVSLLCQRNSLTVLQKPVTLTALRKAVLGLLASTDPAAAAGGE